MKTILTTEYFGPISSYAFMKGSKESWIEKRESYQKKSFRNRTMVSSIAGIQRLSVPLQGGKTGAPIGEVLIAYDEDWIRDHEKAMEMNYKNTPYYEYYIDDICNILRHKHKRLVDLNDAILSYFMNLLDIPVTQLNETTDFQIEMGEEFKDLRKLKTKESRAMLLRDITYRQPFDDKNEFIKDQSILDLVFCLGPEAELYIEKVIK